jgi:hypothetical protein
MNRNECLNAARVAVADRGLNYGKPEDSFAKTAALWTAFLGYPVKVTDVPIMLALLKVARLANDPTHGDSAVDLAGYAACLAEVAASSKGASDRIVSLSRKLAPHDDGA